MRKTEHLTRLDRVLFATAAAALLSLACVLPAHGEGGEVNVVIDSTVEISATSTETAIYSGDVTTQPRPFGKKGKERKRRKAIAAKCIEGRVVEVFHGTYKIGETQTDNAGRWSLTGRKPPTADFVTVIIKEEDRGKGHCEDGREIAKSP